jgi:hypothetical protein
VNLRTKFDCVLVVIDESREVDHRLSESLKIDVSMTWVDAGARFAHWIHLLGGFCPRSWVGLLNRRARTQLDGGYGPDISRARLRVKQFPLWF